MTDSIGTSTRRPGPIGPAWALLPKGEEVLSVPDDNQAWDAIDRMMDSGYSQLPDIKNGRIIGVFTWRCFGRRVADLRRSSIKAIDLPVRDCMEPPRFIDPETFIDTATDWSDVDFVLVGSDMKLIGVLCVADVFGPLNDFAEAFVLIYEIEHEVRDLITEITGDAGLPPLALMVDRRRSHIQLFPHHPQGRFERSMGIRALDESFNWGTGNNCRISGWRLGPHLRGWRETSMTPKDR